MFKKSATYICIILAVMIGLFGNIENNSIGTYDNTISLNINLKQVFADPA